MEYRNLGASGLKVPVISFGTGTFGGQGPLFSAWGRSGAEEARRLIDICLEAGVNLFDTADVYSNGASEAILGAAIKGRRDRLLISTKTSLPMGDGPFDAGSSRHRLVSAVDAALQRLAASYPAGETPPTQRAPDQRADALIEGERHELPLIVAADKRIVDLVRHMAWPAVTLGNGERLHQLPAREVGGADIAQLAATDEPVNR